MISMISSWLFTSTTHQTRQPDNSQSHVLDSPVSYQHQQVELKQTPVMERVQFGNFSTRLPSSGLIPPPPYQRGFIPSSSGVVLGNVPSNNATPGIYPTPPRGPVVMRKPTSGLIPPSPNQKEIIPPSFGLVLTYVPSNDITYGIYPTRPRGPVVMRRPVAGRNPDFHPYRRMEEKPKPSVLEPSKGSILFDSLKERGSMLQDHKVKYLSNMSPDSLNMNNGVCQNIAQPNYQTVLEYSNDLPTSRESTDGVPKVHPLPDEKDFPSEQPDNHENERKVANYVTPSIYPNEYERLMPETKPEVFEKPESAVQNNAQNRLLEVKRTFSHPTEFYGQQLSPPPMANARHVPDVSHNTNPFYSAPNLPTSRESTDGVPEVYPLPDEKTFTGEQLDDQENVWMVADSFYVTPSVISNKYERLMPETKSEVFEKPQSAIQNYAENLLPEVGRTLSHPTEFYGQHLSPPPMANAGHVPDVNHTTPFRPASRVPTGRESTDGVRKVHPLPDEKAFTGEQPDNHESVRRDADYVTPSAYPNEYGRLMPVTKPEVFDKPKSAVQDYAQNRLPEVRKTLSHPTQFYGQQLPPPPMANAGRVPDVNHNTTPFRSPPRVQVPRMAEVCIWIGEDLARYSTNPPTPAESGLRREPLKYNPYQQASHQLTRPKVASTPNAKSAKKAPKPNKPKPVVKPMPKIKPKLQEESEPILVQDEKGSGFSLSRWTGDWFKQTAAQPMHLRDETNQSWRSMI